MRKFPSRTQDAVILSGWHLPYLNPPTWLQAEVKDGHHSSQYAYLTKIKGGFKHVQGRCLHPESIRAWPPLKSNFFTTLLFYLILGRYHFLWGGAPYLWYGWSSFFSAPSLDTPPPSGSVKIFCHPFAITKQFWPPSVRVQDITLLLTLQSRCVVQNIVVYHHCSGS